MLLQRCSLAVALVTVAASPSFAGSVFTMTTVGTDTVAQTLYVQDGMLRVDVDASARTPAASIIFRGGALVVLDPAERRFYRMTPETIEQLGAMLGQANEQMAAAMQQMQQQLANLPPEQRAMMERMMRERMPNLGTIASAVVPTIRVEQGGASSAGGYACTDYTVFADDDRVQEICAADFGTVPGSDEIAVVLGDMQSFFEGLRNAMQSPALAGLESNPFEIMDRIHGMPVRTRLYANGSVAQELVLSSAVEQALDAALFEPPAGYAEQSLIPNRP